MIILIKNKNFSIVIEGVEYRQKEFGIVSDIYHSGAKRAYKKYAGRARKKIAARIEKSIAKDELKYNNALRDYLSMNKVQNKDVERKLLREGKKRGARTFGTDLDGMGGNYTSSSKTSKEIAEALHGQDKKKWQNSANKDAFQIVHPSGSGTELLAHELGHVDNATKGGKIRKAINKRANSRKVRAEFQSSGAYGNDGATGGSVLGTIKESLRRFKNKKLVDIEERNASKRGIKFLKENGASKEEIKQAKENLEKAGKTYKTLGKRYYKFPLLNKVQIPSRRVKGFDLKKMVEESAK